MRQKYEQLGCGTTLQFVDLGVANALLCSILTPSEKGDPSGQIKGHQVYLPVENAFL